MPSGTILISSGIILIPSGTILVPSAQLFPLRLGAVIGVGFVWPAWCGPFFEIRSNRCGSVRLSGPVLFCRPGADRFLKFVQTGFGREAAVALGRRGISEVCGFGRGGGGGVGGGGLRGVGGVW